MELNRQSGTGRIHSAAVFIGSYLALAEAPIGGRCSVRDEFL